MSEPVELTEHAKEAIDELRRYQLESRVAFLEEALERTVSSLEMVVKVLNNLAALAAATAEAQNG